MSSQDAPAGVSDMSPIVVVTPADAAGRTQEDRMLHRPAAARGPAAGLLLVLAGCGAAESDGTAAPYTPGEAIRSALASQQARATQTDERSGPGPVAKEVGQEARLVGEDDAVLLSFTVEAVRPDVTCDVPGAPAPAVGRFVAVDLTVTAGAELPGELSFDPSRFTVTGPDHVPVPDLTGPGAVCLRDAFPAGPLAPGGTYRGTVVLDSPVSSGLLGVTPLGPDDADWQWEF